MTQNTNNSISVLSLSWRLRQGATNLYGRGAYKTERHHLDFVINGKSLFDALGAVNYDFVGCLGWAIEGQDELTIRQLLLEEPAPIPAHRNMLFVCSECGDLGCGAITSELTLCDGIITWRDFAYENDYDPEMTNRDKFRHVGPFGFDFKQYSDVLQNWPSR